VATRTHTDPPPLDPATLAALPETACTLDTTGTLCPYPIVETARAVKGLPPGAVVRVLATDPGVTMDMPMWCKATRNEHLGTYRDGAAFVSYVRKRG
jgi:TusA-related sulfurtransferase